MLLDAGLEGDAPQGRDDRDPAALEVVRSQARLPPRSSGKTRRVERVVPGADVEVARRVARRSGEAAEHDGAGAEVGMRTARDPAVGALHAEQAGVAGWDANRAAPVAAGRERDDPSRHRGRAAGRRAAHGSSVSPRVVGNAVQFRHAHVQPAELAGSGEADGNRAADSEQSFDHRARAAGHAVAKHERPFGLRPTRHRLELFHADGQAAEGPRDVGVLGSLKCAFAVDEREGVERAALDRGEDRLELLARGALTTSKCVDERARVVGPGCSGHEAMMPPVGGVRESGTTRAGEVSE
jgi:hypothetical protein